MAHRRASDICSSLCPEQKISVPSGDGQVWSSCSTRVCLLSVLQLIRRSLPTLGKDHPISPSSYARVTLTSKHPLRMPRIMFKRISGHLRPMKLTHSIPYRAWVICEISWTGGTAAQPHVCGQNTWEMQERRQKSGFATQTLSL